MNKLLLFLISIVLTHCTFAMHRATQILGHLAKSTVQKSPIKQLPMSGISNQLETSENLSEEQLKLIDDVIAAIAVEPIIDFARRCQWDKVKECIEQGKNVNTVNDTGWTALDFAVTSVTDISEPEINAKKGYETIELLLKHGAKVSEYALHRAILRDNLTLVQLFVTTGANDLFTALELAFSHEQLSENHKNNEEIINFLINTILNDQDKDGNTLLHSYLSKVRLEDHTPYASNFTYKRKCYYLLKQPNLGVNIQNKKGETPLHIAMDNHNDLAKALIVNGKTDSNIQDDEGMTPLHRAARNNTISLAELLLVERTKSNTSIKVNVNVQDKLGFTPLHYAVSNNNWHLTKLLVNRGANTSIQDNVGRTALDLAQWYGHKNIASFLSSRNVLLNKPITSVAPARQKIISALQVIHWIQNLAEVSKMTNIWQGNT